MDHMDHHGAFWSMLASNYESLIDRQLGGRTRSLIRERLEHEGPLGRATEFGCGTGYFTSALSAGAETLLVTDASEGMLKLAKRRVGAPNVAFALEDCQRTSLPDASIDTAFMALVIQFTDPAATIAEMHRILRRGGRLIIANLDPMALPPLARLRAVARVLYLGVVGYRLKPPKGFGRQVVCKDRLVELLTAGGFRVDSVEVVADPSFASSVPVDYVRATRI
jgi:ubiquinone/menaquinone biosynthesis C-methylase UbiE